MINYQAIDECHWHAVLCVYHPHILAACHWLPARRVTQIGKLLFYEVNLIPAAVYGEVITTLLLSYGLLHVYLMQSEADDLRNDGSEAGVPILRG